MKSCDGTAHSSAERRRCDPVRGRHKSPKRGPEEEGEAKEERKQTEEGGKEKKEIQEVEYEPRRVIYIYLYYLYTTSIARIQKRVVVHVRNNTYIMSCG